MMRSRARHADPTDTFRVLNFKADRHPRISFPATAALSSLGGGEGAAAKGTTQGGPARYNNAAGSFYGVSATRALAR